MVESIRIRNLGPLRDVEIENIRPMTVLIGESGSGKSLLMKTLILFRYIYKMLNIRWYLRNSNVNKSRFKLAMDHLLTPELKLYFKANKQVEVVYTVSVNGRTHSVAYRNGTIDRKSLDNNIPNEDLFFLKESWISEMRNIIPEWTSFERIPKKRSRDFYFLETLSDFTDATDEIANVPLEYLGLSLNVVKKGNNKKFFVSPIDDAYPPIEWKFSSSGAQTSSSIPTLIRYFSSVFSFKDAIGRSIINYLYETDTLRQYKPDLEPLDMKKVVHIHIEEPELNLYPNAQCQLMDLIARDIFQTKLPDRELKLIIATHSPYIVNYLNILMNQTDDNKGMIPAGDLAVYRLYNGRLQSLMAMDEQDRRFVDTYDLTEPMEAIMNEYETLTRKH